MAHTRPIFIALEGIDGSGKSTQAERLCHRLKDAGYPAIITREPTGSPIGRLIRDAFNHRLDMDDRVIAGLFVADRLHHLLARPDGILATLENGISVICDRYYLSSLAYQGAHMSLDWVLQANAQAMDLRKPDIHLFLDMPPEKAMERISGSREALEKYESLTNLRQVREAYWRAMEVLKDKERIAVIPAEGTEEEVEAGIWSRVSPLLT